MLPAPLSITHHEPGYQFQVVANDSKPQLAPSLAKPPIAHDTFTCHPSRAIMDEEELPPPYSLVEHLPNPTPRPSVRPRPSAYSRSLSTSAADLRPRPVSHGPISNASFSSRGSTIHASSSTNPGSLPFGIVKKQLVTLDDVKTHLRFLRAFKMFREKVEDPYSDPELSEIVPPIGRDIGPHGRWLWFLEMAVERSVSFQVLALPGSSFHGH